MCPLSLGKSLQQVKLPWLLVRPLPCTTRPPREFRVWALTCPQVFPWPREIRERQRQPVTCSMSHALSAQCSSIPYGGKIELSVPWDSLLQASPLPRHVLAMPKVPRGGNVLSSYKGTDPSPYYYFAKGCRTSSPGWAWGPSFCCPGAMLLIFISREAEGSQ